MLELTDRTIPLAISGTGTLSGLEFMRMIDLMFSGNGSMSTPMFDWYFSIVIVGTGGFLYTGGDPVNVHGGLLMDRGFIDRGTVVGSGFVNCVPPVIVDRTIPLEIAGTGSMAWNFCRLYDFDIFGTGQIAAPIFDWQFSYGISGTGQMSTPLVNRTILLDLFATGKFTSEEWTRVIELYFGGTGSISTPVPFIPVHYLTAAINGTAHFWDPALLREITNISALIKGGSVKRSLADKMFTAQLEFAERAGYSPLSGNPWQKVTFYQPNYLGNFYPVFVGIFPSSRQNTTAASMPSYRAETEVLTAYDYAWYLSMQYVSNWIDDDGMPHNEQILLTPTDQAKQVIHNLAFDHLQSGKSFKVGDWVVGGSSGNAGMVIQINAGGLSNHIRLEYLTPSGQSTYFTSGEQLQVGGTYYANADGHSTDETGTVYTMYPDDYIKELLGGGSAAGSNLGAFWQYTTGIYPYRLNNITYYWAALPAIEFPFTLQTTKTQAIEKICKYCEAVFYVKWRSDVSGFVGTYTPCAYLVRQSEIDSDIVGLDLPSAAYLTYGGGVVAADLGRFVKGDIAADFKGEDQYNWVSIRCQDLNGKWLESHIVPGTTCGVSVYDPVQNPTGTEIKRSYYEESSEIATQSDLNARADDIYAYYHYQINTWKATFYKRSDLELLQRVIVSGFGTSVIGDGTYRIIDIQYDYGDGGAKNEVTVTLILDTQFVTYLNLKRIFYNSIYEIQNVVNEIINNRTGAVYGTVTEVGTGYVKFSVVLNDTITKFYTGYTAGNSIKAGDRILAVPDNKGDYIVVWAI
jgi:hypothetical protein